MTYEVTGKKIEYGVPIYSLHTITENIKTGWYSQMEKGIFASPLGILEDLERAKAIFKNKYPNYFIFSIKYLSNH